MSQEHYKSTPTRKDEQFGTAMEYLDRVKARFDHREGVRSEYTQFLEIMHAIQYKRLEADVAIRQVQFLFRDHPDLLQGLNLFLPVEYHINSTPMSAPPAMTLSYPSLNEDPMKMNMNMNMGMNMNMNTMRSNHNMVVPNQMTGQEDPDLERATSYVLKVKQRFLNSPETFYTFHRLLRNHHMEQKDDKAIYGYIQELFKDHPDLIREFHEFLPDRSAPPPPPPPITEAPPAVKIEPPVTRSYTQANTNNNPYLNETPHVPKEIKIPTVKIETVITERDEYSYEELEPFFQIKYTIGEERYTEFLRLLCLFNDDIISTKELCLLASDILSGDYQVCSWFTEFVGSKMRRNCIEFFYQHNVQIIKNISMRIFWRIATW
eukprot:TRINITY_DN686_c0_g1_i3.p1 TRINITY_DN686_c0_g1~~TRINITY_DN686_c0_g1_i3.p1  ORF type:complete len:377 (-),score=69.09 TRINITY_DN686_c0_g1_i3:551-1681(-)